MSTQSVPVLVVFGCPGAGKGSLAGFLAEDHGFAHLSTGAMMRAWATAGDSPEQLKLRAGLKVGQYGSDELAAKIVFETIAGLPGGTPAVILDGYPRNPAQLDAWRSAGGGGQAVVIEVDEDVAVARITDRGTCPLDGTGYRGVGLPCPRCGTPTVRRNDDKEVATIRDRFVRFRSDVLPVIEAWTRAGLPIERIDGDISLEDLRDIADWVAYDVLEGHSSIVPAGG